MSSKDKGHIAVLCLAFGILIVLTYVQLTPGQFYALEDDLRNYSESVLKCRSLGHDGLAIVDSIQKLQNVIKTIKYNKTQQYWIGMHYSDLKKRLVWDTGVYVTWADWLPGEPDALDSDKCVRIRANLQYGTWNCSEKFMAVCGNYSKIFYDMTVNVPQQVNFFDPLWSGSASSLVECVTQCISNPQCQHSVYNSSDLTCVTLSKSYYTTGSVQRTLYGSLVSKDDVTLV